MTDTQNAPRDIMARLNHAAAFEPSEKIRKLAADAAAALAERDGEIEAAETNADEWMERWVQAAGNAKAAEQRAERLEAALRQIVDYFALPFGDYQDKYGEEREVSEIAAAALNGEGD